MMHKGKIGKYRYSFQFSIRKYEGKQVQGYTNRCSDGKYLCFLDYDNMELEWVKAEIIRLQEDFQLSEFHLFQSNENCYHAVCLDKLTLRELISILGMSSVDENYIKVPLHCGRKIWTLRYTDKQKPIKYLETLAPSKPYLSNELSLREQSLSHAKLLTLLFNNPVFIHSIRKPDKLQQICLARYSI